MEESEGVNCCSEGRSPSESRPPNPNPSIASAYRQCQRKDPVVLACRNSLVRHASLVRIFCFLCSIIVCVSVVLMILLVVCFCRQK